MNKVFTYLCSVDGSRQQYSYSFFFGFSRQRPLPITGGGFFIFRVKREGDWKAAP